MMYNHLMTQEIKHKVGFIGVGNLASAMISGWIDSGYLTAEQIAGSNRSEGKLHRAVEQFGIKSYSTNEELIDSSQIVVLAAKPQDLTQALESIASSFGPEHVVISLAAGLPLAHLRKLIPNVSQWVRVMPNTAVKIRQGVSGFYLSSGAKHLASQIEKLLAPFGTVVQVDDEEKFAALAVGCSAGVGFIFELMQYWQEWLEEHDIAPQAAREITAQTFLGASMLAQQSPQTTLLDLQSKVTSKKGITSAGLESMRELEIERLLRYSFEKAALRDREIADQLR